MKWEEAIRKLFANRGSSAYRGSIDKEADHWGSHYASGSKPERNAWLEHPVILESYWKKNAIEGEIWHRWLPRHFGGRARHALDLGCGNGSRDREIFGEGVAEEIVGLDISQKCLDEAVVMAGRLNYNISYRKEDINEMDIEKNQFDLIYSCHSFHHFFRLEHIMEEVLGGLTDNGLFILEEFVGPSQFQWTDKQLRLTDSMLALIPKRYRKRMFGIVKERHGRPTPDEVKNVSPFEAIRSSDIVPLFYEYFKILYHKNLGGTIQHLLYSGIMQNFDENEGEANEIIRCVDELESILIKNNEIPSDFALLVGQKKLTL